MSNCSKDQIISGFDSFLLLIPAHNIGHFTSGLRDLAAGEHVSVSFQPSLVLTHRLYPTAEPQLT